MSDNKNKNIQDRGWSDMRSILDKELPEKKKKRRPIIWFTFGVAAIALISVASLFIFSNQGENSKLVFDESKQIEKKSLLNKEVKVGLDKSSLEEEKTISENKKTINKDEYQNAINNNANQVKFSDIAAKTRQNETLVKSSNDQSIINNSAKIISNTTNEKILKDSKKQIVNLKKAKDQDELISILKPFVDNTIRPNIEIKTTNIGKINTPTNTEGPKSVMEKDMNRSLISPVLLLPIFTPLEIDNIEKLGGKDRPIIALNSNNSLSPYVFASVMSRSNLNRFGYGLGAGLNYKKDNLELYVEASYFRSNYNKEESSSVYADRDPAIFSPTLNIVEEGDTIISSLDKNNEKLEVSNFSRITTSTDEFNINLGIRKQLYKKLKLNAGVSFAILLNATNKSTLLNINSSEPALERVYFQLSSSELHNSGAYSSYDIVPHLGIEYAIFSNVHLGVNYNYGLKNLISNTELSRYSSLSEEEEIYRRNLSAKIRYQF